MMDLIRRIFGSQKSDDNGSRTIDPAPPSSPAVSRPTEEIARPHPPIEEVISASEPLASNSSETVSDAPMQTRPLPPLKTFKSEYRRLAYGSVSNIGGRTNNEDSSLALLFNASSTGNPPNIGVFIVADGMGGHENGEYASATTIQTLAQFVIGEIILPQLTGKEFSADQKTIPEVLAEAMSQANQLVQLNYPGGGTTATCAVIRDDLAYIAHVGDSRAYLLTDGEMELVTRDHLLVRRLQELGQLTPEEADSHPQRNVLYRAVGQAESLEIDAATRRLPPSSRLLICSDGLWGVLGDSVMKQIMDDYSDPQEACERLIAETNAQNGQDNITAVIVQMPY